MRILGVVGVSVSIAGGVLVGCSGSDGRPRDPVSGEIGARLRLAADCTDLLASIQADAIAKLDQLAAKLKQSNGQFDGTYTPGNAAGGFGGTTGSGGAAIGSGAGAAAGAGNAGNAPGSGGGGAAGPSDPVGHSETNTQVEGVDEADIVKIAGGGEQLYVLHGNRLEVLDSWPAAETSLIGGAELEGTTLELFVTDDGKAVVFSTVHDTTGELGGTPGGCFDCYGSPAFTKLTVLDVSSATPSVLREVYLEGNYVSSRRHGSVVRSVVQGGFSAPALYYPNLSYTNAWGEPYEPAVIHEQIDQWRDRVADDIRATTLEDWLPSAWERTPEGLVAIAPQCGNYYVPAPGLVNYGETNIVSLDLAAVASPIQQTVVLGASEHVYANQNSLVLAHHDLRWDMGDMPSQQAALHLFEIAQDETVYRASGFVPGYIHNQFSIDVKDDVLRLSTTTQTRTDPENQPWLTTSVNQVVTLGVSGSELVKLGETPPLAPGETIFATRFVGDRAYVVTFVRTDPLFTVDLSDPKNPVVTGELHIPGFSDYIHPLGDTHLLTIGQDATEQGVVQGLLLQIFDVSDVANPTLLHRHAFTEYGYSEANANHKAFTYYADRQLLAFPYLAYSPTFASTLQLFHVDVQDGLSPMGAIDHAGLMSNSCTFDDVNAYYYCPYPAEMRRGLFVSDDDTDYVYAVSYGGVTAHALDDLSAPLASVPLPAPVFDSGYGSGGVGGIGTGTGGFATGGGFSMGGTPSAGGSAGAAGAAPGGAGGTFGGSGGTGGDSGGAAGMAGAGAGE